MNRFMCHALALTMVVLTAACSDPTTDKPKAEVADPKAATDAASVPAPSQPTAMEELALSSETSKLGFVGSKVTGSHEGEFKSFTGAIKLAAGSAVGGGVSVEIDMTSVVADNDRLTGHLKSADFFDVEKFATASFVSSSIEAAAAGDEGPSHTVTGDLTLHGVTKTIKFPATIMVSDSSVTAKSEFAINRKDFGIVYAGKTDDLIRDNVLLKLDISAARSGGM